MYSQLQTGIWPAVLGAVVLLSIVLISSTFRTYWRLRHFKGPPLATLSKLWLMGATAKGQMHLDLANACKKYGPLTRIGPNQLVTSDPEILRRINGVRSPWTRSDWYNATAFDHKLNHIFCERDEQRHLDLRNRLIPGYSGKENESLEQRIDDRILDLCALIERKYLSAGKQLRAVDLSRLASYFTLDVIYTVALGEPMGFLERDEDVHGYLANQVAMLPVFEWLSTLPALEKLLRVPWISKLAMPTPEDKTGVGLLLGVARKIVARRYGAEKEVRKDMLGSFVEHGLSQPEAEMESVLQIIAGSDTTATAIRMTMFYVMTDPEVYKNLQNQIDEAENAGKISHPVIQYQETQELPYVEACVKEALRICPPVMGLNGKLAPKEGDTLNGKFVPGGTEVGYCAFGLHRRKEIFGDDADFYRPERWLEATNEQLAEMNRTIDLVFGFGRYSCLGKPVAWIEMRKAIAELLRRYNFTIVNPMNPFKSVNRNGLFIQNDMFVRISRRKE